jgi:hypothetical protein
VLVGDADRGSDRSRRARRTASAPPTRSG